MPLEDATPEISQGHEPEPTLSERLLRSQLLEGLLQKCECTSVPEFYHKFLDANNGVVPVSKIISYEASFTAERIRSDISTISGIIYLELLPPTHTLIKRAEVHPNEGKIGYIATLEGFSRIFAGYKRKFFRNGVTIKTLMREWGLWEEEKGKLMQFLTELLDNRAIPAAFNADQTKITYEKRHAQPGKKRQKIQLLVAIAFLVLSIVVFFTIQPILGQS
jgi:hypothetical protein